jgi:hypothetical protein
MNKTLIIKTSPDQFFFSFLQLVVEVVDLDGLTLELGLDLLHLIGQLGVLIFDAFHLFGIDFLHKNKNIERFGSITNINNIH